MKQLKPTISFRLQSRTAVHNAPLWLMKATLPGPRHSDGKGGIEAGQRTHNAQAIGTDYTERAAPGIRQNLLFELQAGRTGFLESRGQDYGALDTGVGAFSYKSGYRIRLRGNDGQIYILGDRGYIRVCLDAEHARKLRIYREYGPSEWIADQIP